MLADAKVQVSSAVLASFKITCAFKGEPRFCGGGQVGRASHQPRDISGHYIQHLGCRLAAGNAFGIGREGGQIFIPAIRQFAPLHAVKLIGQLRKLFLVAFEKLFPLRSQLFAALADSIAEVLDHTIRNQEFGVLRPAVSTLGKSNLFFAERLAVSGLGVLFVRSAVSDVAVNDDEGGAVALEKGVQGPAQHGEIVGIAHAGHIPSIAHEARSNVFTEGQRGVSLDGDVIVVVDPAEI